MADFCYFRFEEYGNIGLLSKGDIIMAEGDLLNEYIEVYFSAFKYVGELVSEPMKRYKLSFEQFLIMRDLAAGHELALSAIAAKRGVTRAAISRQIKTLLEQGYVVQERDQTDRRRQFLHLTVRGEQVSTKLNATITARFGDWVAVIGEQDAKELLRIMTRVGDTIIQR